ncbi:uncharacterized protein LOC119391684 [Rhipicephalus sanguineus]|uniref:uncharacterized protein LOC119391684 n=1 Tax=Rhipicephalus sanguineus TaxID=34632 RepID=UPI0020C4B02A|nr:uncharacterized protein LOC119391684 [Rhipicephalus sanguineus]
MWVTFYLTQRDGEPLIAGYELDGENFVGAPEEMTTPGRIESIATIAKEPISDVISDARGKAASRSPEDTNASKLPAATPSSPVVNGSDTNARQRRLGHKRRPEVVVALTVGGVLVGALFSAVLGMLFMKTPKRLHNEATVTAQPDGCLTVECRFVADKMLAAMNQSVQPCDDFYEYMCGNYHGPDANMFAAVEQKIQGTLKEQLKSTTVPEIGQSAWEKAAGMFQACIDVGVTLNTQMADLRSWLASKGLDFFNMTEDASYDAVDALVMLSLQCHMPALLALEVDRMRFLNKKRFVSFVFYKDDVEWYLNYHMTNQSNITGKRSRYEVYLSSYGLRDDALNTMSRTLEAYGSQDLYFLSASQVAATLDHLAKQPTDLTVVRIADLGNLTKVHVDSGRWVSIFGRYTGGIYGGEDYIQVQSSAPTLLVELLSSSAVGTHGLRCLLAWRVLRWVGDLASTASAGAQANRQPFDNVCYELVLLVMEPVLMRKYDDIDELEDSKPTRFFRDWRIALELYARRLVRDQQHLLFLSVTANVSYSTAANAIIVPAASLHPGIFYQGGPASVNYGGLGTVVAREMSQILDIQPLTPEQGHADLWNRSDVAKHYASTARCLLKSLQEAQHLFHAQLTGDPPDSENLADVMGLLAAYSAFTGLPHEERAVTLHGSPLNSDQTFYAFHCAKLCEAKRKTSSHSRQGEARLRCVVPLMNSEAFAEAFKCPDSSPMNPPRKCSLW